MMKFARLTFLSLFLLLCFQRAASAASNCSAARLAEVRAPATESQPSVWVNCNLTLSASDVITKRLRVRGAAANDITIDCNGARLDGTGTPSASLERIRIDSQLHMEDDDTCTLDSTGHYCSYDRPENVTVRDCDIYGTVRVGETMVGEPEVSRHEDYTQAARKYAPKDIRFEDVTIHEYSAIPIYVYPGVVNFQLIDSHLYGAAALALYLDRESHRHEIRNNHFGVDTSREIIAIDGSSENLIVNNYFVYTKNGGIYLYRNCGEAPGNWSEEPGTGTIRHATPSFNHIINNQFNNGNYSGDKANIWLGQRNRTQGGICDADLRSDGTPYPWGSSVSNWDYAHSNVVMQNQFYNRSPEDMVLIGNPAGDRDNVIADNEQVSSGIDREAGCYLPTSITSPLLEHGVIQSVIVGDIQPTSCERLTCDDGVLATTGTCPFVAVNFSCQVTGSNSGCHSSKACPTIDGRPGRVASAKAACNLESGSVTSQQAYEVFLGEVNVVRASDNLSDGVCYVEQTDISSAWADIWTSPGDTNLSFGCMEHDSNGGDCHIKGTLYCE